MVAVVVVVICGGIKIANARGNKLLDIPRMDSGVENGDVVVDG